MRLQFIFYDDVNPTSSICLYVTVFLHLYAKHECMSCKCSSLWFSRDAFLFCPSLLDVLARALVFCTFALVSCVHINDQTLMQIMFSKKPNQRSCEDVFNLKELVKNLQRIQAM